MLIRKLLLATVACGIPRTASRRPRRRAPTSGVYLNFGPPAVHYERAPALRVGYVWVPGFWDWRYNRHHWVAGHWVRHRPGYHYHPSRWTQHDGRWRYDRGRWDRPVYRDRDRTASPTIATATSATTTGITAELSSPSDARRREPTPE